LIPKLVENDNDMLKQINNFVHCLLNLRGVGKSYEDSRIRNQAKLVVGVLWCLVLLKHNVKVKSTRLAVLTSKFQALRG
jgi:hypothetical protein